MLFHHTLNNVARGYDIDDSHLLEFASALLERNHVFESQTGTYQSHLSDLLRSLTQIVQYLAKDRQKSVPSSPNHAQGTRMDSTALWTTSDGSTPPDLLSHYMPSGSVSTGNSAIRPRTPNFSDTLLSDWLGGDEISRPKKRSRQDMLDKDQFTLFDSDQDLGRALAFTGDGLDLH
ncbi:hypothetical protein NA57DRAFT_56354 [Rhizodiscina lignyota]|uniref:Uncharacterized protein n=1 Tax=Rhizodiscina lignyota TaxID=1504668 RepID=A0A9P4IG61_9PEZI|nr:hypothetical protein NA57DRAFT_56354 [Rhizodiscina lignyota]